MALIAFLKNADTRTAALNGDYSVGNWLLRFCSLSESPKGARNVAENRPYSIQSVDPLKSLYETHMKDDSFMELLMIQETGGVSYG
jgi:hypothetical protein